MTSTIEAIGKTSLRKSIEAEERYHQLCCSAARGETVAPDEAIDTIAKAGRSQEQFATDVRTIETRLQHCELLETRPKVTLRLRMLKDELAAKLRQLEQFRQKIQSESRQLEEEISELNSTVLQIDGAEQALRSTVVNGSILLRREELAAERVTIAKQIERVRLALRENEPGSAMNALRGREIDAANATAELERVRHSPDSEQFARVERQAKVAATNLADSRDRVAHLETELAELNRAYASIESRTAELATAELLP